ncbi:hypothetical protein KBD75_01275 [Candidatus Woesebacteria bacterium]|nr:hypothetical protein [Candidatus Woesebacteria bacterium]
MKKFFPLFLVIWLVACAPATPVAPTSAASTIDTSSTTSDEPFAGKVESAPANVTWYSPEDLPSESGVSATIRQVDNGLRLVVSGNVMPVWNSNGVWKMSDGLISDKDTNPVRFEDGEVGVAGNKGIIVYVRQVDGNWQVGIIE